MNRLIVLASRPAGIRSAANFRLVEEPIPEAGAGQALVRNQLMSVDPSMRPRMNDVPSYVAPFQIDRPLEGRAVGEVIASRNPALPVGALVMHRFGWREYALVDEGTVLDTAAAPASAYLGVLGNSGLTAYAGVVRIARLKAGETIYISAAAGAVGSAAGQIAKRLGATTIGSSGSAENVRFLLDDLHYDRAFQVHDGAVAAELQRAAPEGIDVYFDSVGGETLDAALRALQRGARRRKESVHDGQQAPADGGVSRLGALRRTSGIDGAHRAGSARLTLRRPRDILRRLGERAGGADLALRPHAETRQSPGPALVAIDSGWVAAIASIASAFIVAVTAVAAFQQIRHFRNANDIVVYLRLIEQMDSPEMMVGRNNLAMVAEKVANDPEYRERLTDPTFMPEEFRSVGILLRFLEHICVLVTKGGVAENLVLAEYADTFLNMWNLMRPAILQRRVAFGPHTGRAFEHLAMRAKAYIESGAMEREYNALQRDPRDVVLPAPGC